MTAQGTILGRGLAGSANYRAASQAQAAQAIQAAVTRALSHAYPGTAIPTVTAVSIGCSGLEGPGEPDDAKQLLGDTVRAEHYFLDTDVYTGLLGAFGGGPGIFVVAGTGSIALGLDPQGTRVRAGGWGNRFGDEGSAFWIASQAIRGALKTADRRHNSVALWHALQRFVGMAPSETWHVDDQGVRVTDWLYASDRTIPDIAAFAPHIHTLADQGDPTAQSILTRAGASLAELILTIAKQLATTKPIQLSCSGGVWTHNPYVREAFHHALQEARLPYQYQNPTFTADVGAVLAAVTSLGMPWPNALSQVQTVPEMKGHP